MWRGMWGRTRSRLRRRWRRFRLRIRKFRRRFWQRQKTSDSSGSSSRKTPQSPETGQESNTRIWGWNVNRGRFWWWNDVDRWWRQFDRKFWRRIRIQQRHQHRVRVHRLRGQDSPNSRHNWRAENWTARLTRSLTARTNHPESKNWSTRINSCNQSEPFTDLGFISHYWLDYCTCWTRRIARRVYWWT